MGRDQSWFSGHEEMIEATVRLVNALTGGHDGGRPVAAPTGQALRAACAEAVRPVDEDARPTLREAHELANQAAAARLVFQAVSAGDRPVAVERVNAMLRSSDARPELHLDREGRPALHFHGPVETFTRGWATGIAAALAVALGGDLIDRLGVCSAPSCDRVFRDLSKNSHRRFCSIRCQNRVKTAAYRQRIA